MSSEAATMGPLAGVKVLEMDALGPVPWAAMMLADMGADVLRIDRPSAQKQASRTHLVALRGRRSVVIDLKQPGADEAVLELVAQADILLEGSRPGVMERLGLGPEPCLQRNPRLVYGRMTGWGQTGPWAHKAGHDINYIAATGVLHAIGSDRGKPAVPLNLVADLGGGGMLVALGVVSALLHARAAGQGQVVDAAMMEGCNALMASVWGRYACGEWLDARENNLLDGGAPFYDCYETADGRWLAVGSIEPQFYAALLQGLGLQDAQLPAQHDRKSWPILRQRIADAVRGRRLNAWAEAFSGLDACVTPVLSLAEAQDHPQQRARAAFATRAGIAQPMPAPRFSRTESRLGRPPGSSGEGAAEALRDWLGEARHPVLRVLADVETR